MKASFLTSIRTMAETFPRLSPRTGIPDGAKSLALIMNDPDAPSGVFVHWLVYRIPPTSTELDEDLPATSRPPQGVLQGRNEFGDLGYGGHSRLRGLIAISFISMYLTMIPN